MQNSYEYLHTYIHTNFTYFHPASDLGGLRGSVAEIFKKCGIITC